MEKRYKVFIAVYDSIGDVTYAEAMYEAELRAFRTRFGAVSFLKRIVRKFKR